MKKDREYQDYLEDILDAISKASAFIAGMSFSEFSLDNKTVFAVIHALEIIGEATKHLPEWIRENNPDVPWRESVIN